MSSDEQSIDDSQFSDLYAHFFSTNAKDLRYDMAISLREAMFGGLRQIVVRHLGELPSWRFLDQPKVENLVFNLFSSFREPDHRYRFRFLDRIQSCKL